MSLAKALHARSPLPPPEELPAESKTHQRHHAWLRRLRNRDTEIVRSRKCPRSASANRVAHHGRSGPEVPQKRAPAVGVSDWHRRRSGCPIKSGVHHCRGPQRERTHLAESRRTIWRRLARTRRRAGGDCREGIYPVSDQRQGFNRARPEVELVVEKRRRVTPG